MDEQSTPLGNSTPPADESFEDNIENEAEEGDEEEERHQELIRYRILDTDPEQCFDDITYVASVACHAPICMISFLDSFANRLFYKSKIGYDNHHYSLGDEPQKVPCVQCIQSDDEVYEIEDIKNPKRPVAVPETICFYAGVRLVSTHGLAVGTICVLDNKPRKLSDEQKRVLIKQARQVVSQLELRAARLRIESLQSSSKELQKQLEEKTRILGVVSHDIRQPLSGIMVSSELMLADSDLNLPSKYQSLLKNNLHAAKFMNRLVGELLEIVQYDLDRSQLADNLDTEMTDMVSFVNRILMQHVMSANRKNIKLKYGVSWTSDMPATTFVQVEHLHSRMMRRRSSTSIIQWNNESGDIIHNTQISPITCLIDVVKMEQVITNLISNALKYSNMDTTVEVIVGKQNNDTKAYVAVKDQGPGIPEKELPNLFKPFMKIPGIRPTGGESSIGLGLAIVKGIVDAHCGDVQVTSVEGEYTQFKVVLPLHVQSRRISSSSSSRYSSLSGVSSNSMAQESNGSHEVAEEEEKKTLNILVADDNNLNRRLLAQILETRGHDVTVATDGEEAVRLFEEHGGHNYFNILLVDEQMPKMSGVEVIRHIRQIETVTHEKRIPILSISGHCTEDYVKRIMEAGADGTCSKPFKINDIVVLVEQHGFKNVY